MKNEFIALIILFLLVSCQSRQQVTENISTIDSILQVNVTSLLENKLSELDALSGQAIVMEVQSGQIKALVGLTKKDSTNYQSCENFSVWQSTGLMHPISLLAALETGKVKLSDKVDTGNGIYQIHGRELKDHNWHRGGYGVSLQYKKDWQLDPISLLIRQWRKLLVIILKPFSIYLQI